jgi:hypothetical protein
MARTRIRFALRLVAQTLERIACMAIPQKRAPTPATVMPQLRSALASRIDRRTGQGVAPGSSTTPVEDAFIYMRSYGRANGEHLTDVARRLMTGRRDLRIRHGVNAIGGCCAWRMARLPSKEIDREAKWPPGTKHSRVY